MSKGGSFDRGELCARRKEMHNIEGVPDEGHLWGSTGLPLQQCHRRRHHVQVTQGLADGLGLHQAVRGARSLVRGENK